MTALAMRLATFLGPWLVRAAPWLTVLPGLGTLKRWAIGASYAAALALGAWGGASVLSWWRGDQITVAEADTRGKAKCDAAIAETEIKAREAALRQRESAVRQRESEIAADADRIAAYETELEASREKISTDAAPFVGSDDKWLRDWRGKGR